MTQCNRRILRLDTSPLGLTVAPIAHTPRLAPRLQLLALALLLAMPTVERDDLIGWYLAAEHLHAVDQVFTAILYQPFVLNKQGWRINIMKKQKIIFIPP
ncbi:hypothetical protein DPMN_151689 [Dreissena polymorpha]|uniref:Uncharacterized protein n=1 Tax=Dreissena polymorpha TaxID=45954 RepID=A0A9D4FFI9_DREPO|nr:hypothetical protein DPMN_151689 [Dreissena polymorpha]